MASKCPPAKKLKKDLGDDEGKKHDSETQKALEEIDACQNQIDALNEKASEDILKVEQKYNKLRKPFYEKRNQIIKKIPNFWLTAFINHPQITTILDEVEEDCLHYLTRLEVEEFDDIKFGYKIHFFFDPNPYLENAMLTKEFHLGAAVPCTKHTPVNWKEGKDIVKIIKDKREAKGKRKVHFSFFIWYCENSDPSTDDVAEVIKDDLWANPLQYYLVPDLDGDANGVEEDDDGSFGDESVIVVEEDDDDDDDDEDEDDEDDDDDDDDDDVIEEVQTPAGEGVETKTEKKEEEEEAAAAAKPADKPAE